MLKERMIKQPNGIYKKDAEHQPSPSKGRKAYRSADLEQAIVTINGINFNADEQSMDRIDRIVELANFQFNRALSQGVSASDAYASVYSTEVGWKSADDVFHTVTVEMLAEVQEAALQVMQQKWAEYG